MTLAEVLLSAYQVLLQHERAVALACVAIPVAGVACAWLARAATGRGQAGQVIAGLTIWLALGAVLTEVLVVVLARAFFDASLGEAPVLLLLAPPCGAVVAVAGMHWVYPLNQLAAWRTLTDVGWFVLACAAVLWMLSQFRGWGILFGGSLLELALIGAAAWWFLRRLYRRAFR